jgi:hypothetical protein
MTEQLSPADRLLRIIADSETILLQTNLGKGVEIAALRIKTDARAALSDPDGMRERLEKDWPMKAE